MVRDAPGAQRRRVSCGYNQLYLEPAVLDERERNQLYFQEPRESDQGMSLFPTCVAIGSPAETIYVDAEVTIDTDEPENVAVVLEDAVQAVAFPIEVRGSMRLRSVGAMDDDGGDPLAVAPGRYDVLAWFLPAPEASEAFAASALRVFTLRLSFRAAGSLGAPRCLRLETGDAPPSSIYSHA
jgi:hypothetical protein